MTQAELQRWLVEKALYEDLRLLTQATVLTELGAVHAAEDYASQATELPWEKLMLAGSILARSSERRAVDASLRIATAALTLDTTPAIRDAAGLLLEKLSNYRAVELATARGFIRPGLASRLGVSARVEALSREMENSVLVEHTGNWLIVNSFQQTFLDEAHQAKSWISASAPTASGKTFLVLQWLLNELRTTNVQAAVYLAPTRALVSEIQGNLQQLLRRNGAQDISVTSLPVLPTQDASALPIEKTIFVLTQERLHLLANTLNDELHVQLVVADEAHKVGDKLRGVVLQEALERITRKNPGVKIVFVSPATQNPETLLEDAPETMAKRSVDSDSPTVLQNLVLASQAPRQPKSWMLSIREPSGSTAPLGTIELPARPTSQRKKLALIAATAGQRGGTLVYANGAADSEEIALLLSQIVPVSEAAPDPELLAPADLARRGVHDSYQLAAVVKKGVAFHYGNMPSLLREEIERLFRIGKIRFLVCTSTLIEGVNLSCRTIVLRGPRKGKTQPMEPHDFWNLAGRAGRWGNEFQGNIICVDPEDTTAWPNGVPQRKRYPIERETDVVLKSGSLLLTFIGERWDRETQSLSADAQLEQVCAYLLTAFMREGSISRLPIAKRHDSDLVLAIDASLGTISSLIEIPAGLAARHPGVNPVGLQRLLVHFRDYQGDVEDLLPAPPESSDAFIRMVRIMEAVNTHVFPAFQPPTLVPLHTLVVLEWLKGLSLAAIIKARIAYNNRHGRSYQLPKLIRETMELIEQTARFRAPKFISAYVDVLRLHLTAIGRQDLLAEDLDLGIALEFGVSTRTLVSLMELGLSRMSAVALYEKMIMDNLDREQCRSWILEHDEQFEGMDLPLMIVREVRQKILGTDVDAATDRAADNGTG